MNIINFFKNKALTLIGKLLYEYLVTPKVEEMENIFFFKFQVGIWTLKGKSYAH